MIRAQIRKVRMNYQRFFEEAIDQVHAERRYRVFADLERIAGHFPAPSGGRTARPRKSPSGAPTTISAWASTPTSSPPCRRRPAAWASAAGGTRNISGTNHPLVELELALADLHRKEAALVFTSGFVSNEASISTIARLLPDCLIISDELNHASMIEGVRHSGAEKKIFRHNDVAHLRELLAGRRPRAGQADRLRIGLFDGRRRRADQGDRRPRRGVRRPDLYRRSPCRGHVRPARRRHRRARGPDRPDRHHRGHAGQGFRHAGRLHRRHQRRHRRGALLCAGLHLHHRPAPGACRRGHRLDPAPQGLAGRARRAAAPGGAHQGRS